MYKELGLDTAVELEDIHEDDLDGLIEELKNEKNRRIKSKEALFIKRFADLIHECPPSLLSQYAFEDWDITWGGMLKQPFNF